MNRPGLKQAARLCMSKGNARPIIITLVLFALRFIISGLFGGGQFTTSYQIAGRTVQHINPAGVGGVMALSLIGTLILRVISAGYDKYCLNMSRALPASVTDLFFPFTFFARTLWLNILIGVFLFLWSLIGMIPFALIFAFLYSSGIVQAQLASGIWGLLFLLPLYFIFLIPGLVASYRYYMAVFILVDNPQRTARECLSLSKELTAGHKWELFKLDFSFLPWSILSLFTFGILMLWLTPYKTATAAHAYNWLSGGAHQEPYPGYGSQF